MKNKEREFAKVCLDYGLCPTSFERNFINKFGYANEKLFDEYKEIY